jgi:hypothetical protein
MRIVICNDEISFYFPAPSIYSYLKIEYNIWWSASRAKKLTLLAIEKCSNLLEYYAPYVW